MSKMRQAWSEIGYREFDRHIYSHSSIQGQTGGLVSTPRKIVLLDCDDTIEIHQIACGEGTFQRRTKQNFLDAKWDPIKEEYLLPPPSRPFSVRGFPPEIKRYIERLRKENDMDDAQNTLERDMEKQRYSERVMSAYTYVVLVATVSLMLLGIAYSNAAVAWGGIACLVIGYLLRDSFAGRYAPSLGLVKSEDVLFLQLRRAIDALDRFVAHQRPQFLQEGLGLLDVSYLSGQLQTTGWLVVRRPAKQVEQLLSNISRGIGPAIQKSKDKREYVSTAVLPPLRSLLPLLLEPDEEVLDSWNKTTREKFHAPEDRTSLARLRTAVLARPRLYELLRLGASFGPSYAVVAAIAFILTSSLSIEFFTSIKENIWAYLLASNAMAFGLLMYFRREKGGRKKE